MCSWRTWSTTLWCKLHSTLHCWWEATMFWNSVYIGNTLWQTPVWRLWIEVLSRWMLSGLHARCVRVVGQCVKECYLILMQHYSARFHKYCWMTCEGPNSSHSMMGNCVFVESLCFCNIQLIREVHWTSGDSILHFTISYRVRDQQCDILWRSLDWL